MNLKHVLHFLFVGLQLYCTDCVNGYSCSNVSIVANCITTIECPAGQICHTTVVSNMFTLGCKDSALCSVVTTDSPGGAGQIVGRALTTGVSAGCSACCNTGMCNRQLCQNDDHTCHDAGHVDCATTGAFVNLCSEEVSAKQECRRFCGLCSMVDGGWTNWSAWSVCSSSCGNGTVSRTRTCSDPVPAKGGSNCSGATNEVNTCLNDACPVNGGWSTWTGWGSCSVSCGIGLQRRDRTCSSPYPSNSGIHCFGESRDDRICLSRACQDGGWTDWGGWAGCSKTCDTGTRKRSRSCTNPPPSVLGHFCVGDNSEMENCGVKPCHVQQIGFTVTNPHETSTSGHITFTDVITNQGGGYNTATGEFTCSVAGVYSFSLTIVKRNVVTFAECYIYKNSQSLGEAFVNSVSNSIGAVPASVTVYVHLLPGEKVYLKDCTAASTMMSGGDYSTFTGYLIRTD